MFSPASRRRLACLLASSALVLVGACKKTDSSTTDPQVQPLGPSATLDSPVPEARAPVELIRWSVDLQNLAETLAAGEALVAQLRPDAPLNLRAVVESITAQQGLPKAWTDALDWSGRFAIDLAYPQPGQAHARSEDMQLRANFAALDARAALKAIPEQWSPQAQSERELTATRGEIELYFRALSDQLAVGRSLGDLDAAGPMAQRAASHRVVVHAENLHPGDVDPAALFEVPVGIAGPISAALERAESLDLTVDLGRDIDLAANLSAHADLSGFGFDPLGPPLTAPSAVANTLSPGAVGIAVMSWGDPALIHRELDRYAKMIPAPFDAWVAEVIAGAHEAIDQVRDEVVFGLWVDAKGDATLVVAARIKQAEPARAAVRRTLAGAHAVGERYVGLMGDDRDYRAKLEYSLEGLSFSKGKVDLLTATVPKAFLEDAQRVAMFVGTKRPKLTVLSLVEGEVGVVAVGAGARAFMDDYVRNLGGARRVSAESDPGLRLARSVGGGCQLCVGVEPIAALRTYLRHRVDFSGDSEAVGSLAKAQAMRPRGHLALSLQAGDKGAALGVGATKALLFEAPAVLPGVFDALGILPPPPPRIDEGR